MFTYVFICSYAEYMPKVMCCHNLTVNRGKIEKKSLFLSDCMGRGMGTCELLDLPLSSSLATVLAQPGKCM